MPNRWTGATVGDVVALLRTVENPGLVVLDRLGLRRAEYLLRFKDGSLVSARPSMGDRFTIYETFVRDSYRQALGGIPEGGTVVDVGANIGCFTVRAARKAGPHGLVIAVEPEIANYRCLQRNISINQLDNVRMLRCAVAGSTGMRKFFIGSRALFGSIYDEVNSRTVGQAHEMIEAVTLQDLCARHGIMRIDLLKLDCEGAEHEIVFNLTEVCMANVGRIVAEIHSVSGHRSEGVVKYLVERGFRHDFDGLHHFHRD